MKLTGAFGIVFVFIFVLAAYGYISNVVKLAHCDFKSPYKAEALRTIGIVIPPVGWIEGYLTIEDK